MKEFFKKAWKFIVGAVVAILAVLGFKKFRANKQVDKNN